MSVIACVSMCTCVLSIYCAICLLHGHYLICTILTFTIFQFLVVYFFAEQSSCSSLNLLPLSIYFFPLTLSIPLSLSLSLFSSPCLLVSSDSISAGSSRTKCYWEKQVTHKHTHKKRLRNTLCAHTLPTCAAFVLADRSTICFALWRVFLKSSLSSCISITVSI
jgi:hypothetical protein